MKTIYLVGFVCLLLGACGLRKNTYIAPLPNTPKFTKGGDVYFNTAASPTHIEFQGGLALTKGLGIIAGRFYGGSHRWSNELGVNFYSRIISNFYVSNSFGWGQSQLRYAYTHPVLTTSHSALAVDYKTIFLQPGIYYAKEIEDGFIRAGIFTKYSQNSISDYYYREYENVFHSHRLIDEKTYTASPQSFNSIITTFSVEVTQGVFSIGSHFGFAKTEKITGEYSYKHHNSPQLSHQYKTQIALSYIPVIGSAYIGIRL